MSTAVYNELTTKMAMKIGGERRPDFVRQRHWERFAEETESKSKIIFDLCEEFGKRLPELANNLANTFSKEEESVRVLN